MTVSVETFEKAMALTDLFECTVSELFEQLVAEAAEELELKDHLDG